MDTYKINKAIRFRLEAEPEEMQEIVSEVNNLSTSFDLIGFISLLKNFTIGMQEYLFKPQKDENSCLHLKGDFTVKKEWLRLYAKQDLAEMKKKSIRTKK